MHLEIIIKECRPKVNYESSVEVAGAKKKVDCSCIKQHHVKLELTKPFEFEFSTFSMQVSSLMNQ